MIDPLVNKQAQEMIKPIEDVFKSLPHLPKGLNEFFVKIAPWLTGLGGIFGILGGLSSLSGGGAASKFLSNFVGVSSTYFLLSGLVSIVSGVLLLFAFNHLRNKKIEGWMLLFWSDVLAIVQSVLSIVYVGSGIVSSVIGLAIGFYILFEIKPFYNGKKEAAKSEKTDK